MNVSENGNYRFTITDLSTEFPGVSKITLFRAMTHTLGHLLHTKGTNADKCSQRPNAFAGVAREKCIFFHLWRRQILLRRNKHTSSDDALIFRLQKKNQVNSQRKIMATDFWDQKGMLLIEFMERGTTITWQVYCETLFKLRRDIQNRL